MKMQRNKNGEVFIDNELVAKVPADKSALSFLADGNIIHKGEDYTVDEDWVYLEGKPIRKQLHFISGHEYNRDRVRVWKPNLKNSARLEERYWRQVETVKDFHENHWRPAFRAIVEAGGKAHVKPTHKFSGDQNKWWLYNADEIGISFDWVDAPEKPINKKLGSVFYTIDKQSERTYNRRRLFRLALETAFIWELDECTGTHFGYFDHNDFKLSGKQLCFDVNGRKYWYHATFNRGGVLRWNILSWPDHDFSIIKLSKIEG
jgi:hypothetical protein